MLKQRRYPQEYQDYLDEYVDIIFTGEFNLREFTQEHLGANLADQVANNLEASISAKQPEKVSYNSPESIHLLFFERAPRSIQLLIATVLLIGLATSTDSSAAAQGDEGHKPREDEIALINRSEAQKLIDYLENISKSLENKNVFEIALKLNLAGYPSISTISSFNGRITIPSLIAEDVIMLFPSAAARISSTRPGSTYVL